MRSVPFSIRDSRMQSRTSSVIVRNSDFAPVSYERIFLNIAAPWDGGTTIGTADPAGRGRVYPRATPHGAAELPSGVASLSRSMTDSDNPSARARRALFSDARSTA